MKKELTLENIITIAKRNSGEIWISWQYRNDSFRRRLNRLVKKGLFKKAKYQPGTDGFILV
jgi:hypothetical protein